MKITTEQAVDIIESNDFNVTDDRLSDTVYIYDEGEGDVLYYDSDELISAKDFSKCTWELKKLANSDIVLKASIDDKPIWLGWVWAQPPSPKGVLERIASAKADAEHK